MTETKPKPTVLKVGDKIWAYEAMRRSDNWQHLTVVGENRVAFFIGHDNIKFDPERTKHLKRIEKATLKAGKMPSLFALDRKEIDRKAWVNNNRYKLAEAVKGNLTFEQLVRIAEIAAPYLVPPDELREP